MIGGMKRVHTTFPDSFCRSADSLATETRSERVGIGRAMGGVSFMPQLCANRSWRAHFTHIFGCVSNFYCTIFTLSTEQFALARRTGARDCFRTADRRIIEWDSNTGAMLLEGVYGKPVSNGLPPNNGRGS